MAQLISPLYREGLYDNRPRKAARTRLDPQSRYEKELAAMPRRSTLAIAAEDFELSFYLKASFALNARITQSTRYPALMWVHVRVKATETTNAHYLISRLS